MVEPQDYARVLAEMAANGGATTPALRRSLAAKAFARSASYDAAISAWFTKELGGRTPSARAIAGQLAEALRYGRPVELEPMRATERKIVHTYLSERSDVETHSEGDEPDRRLVVSPVERFT